ncbi:PKD-domain containing protein [Candidatus Termititenax dinenymphae]|uniref:PKD-domain containing protein n=1 Tax=Candidatus Termititenax dinenymphae TaxID=2218523 RepID=A0A388TK02_9BACT|nr:PKD-domain containing protein [Candidatus Termititenax dinenymphae]
MAVISVINQKGGCGKTTTSVNVSTGLVRRGYRVLLVDMDPQGHSTLGLGFDPDALTQTVFDVIDTREQDVPLSTVALQPAERLTLLPSNVALSSFEQSMAGKAWRESRLAKVLFKVKNQYDYIIIDCPPSLGLLTVNALLASTHVIVPIDSGFYSLSGVKKLRETVEMLRSKVQHELNIKHVITFYDSKSTFNKDFLSDLHKIVGLESLFKQKIRRSMKFDASQRQGRSVIDLGSKRCGVAFRDYLNLTQEIVEWTKTARNFRLRSLRTTNKTEVRRQMVRAINMAYRGEARDVKIAGAFNDWQPLPLQKNKNGQWETAIELNPGQYEYKFIVDGNWITDPNNAKVEIRNNIVNSVLVVK